MERDLAPEVYAQQLEALHAARKLLEEFRQRRHSDGDGSGRASQRAAPGEAGAGAAAGGTKSGGDVEPASRRDVLQIHVDDVAPNTSTQLDIDIDYIDTWDAEISLRVSSFGGGLFPLLSVLHEADLVADFIPRAPGLPYLEMVDKPCQFANNDWVYHIFVTPWG